jgi:hypothetical protein
LPVWVAATIWRNPFSPSAASALRSSPSTALNGGFVLQSGCRGASALIRSIANMIWKYIGCSAHSVPSLSNVAMRASTGTKSAPPGVVTRGTKSVIDFFTGPSFQEGRGSAGCAHAAPVVQPDKPAMISAAANASATRVVRLMSEPLRSTGQPPCGLFSCSMIWSTLKLDGFCRGGKSRNVAMNCETTACVGTTRKARSSEYS